MWQAKALYTTLLLLMRGVLFRRKIVVFFVPKKEMRSGGILSIFALCRYSREILKRQNTFVVLCSYPGNTTGQLRFTFFENTEIIFDSRVLFLLVPFAKHFVFHLPEYAVASIWQDLKPYVTSLKKRGVFIQANVLNQNTLMMPTPSQILEIQRSVNILTITTAHPQYSNRKYTMQWGVNCHALPAWSYNRPIVKTSFSEKENVLVISPDKSDYTLQTIDIIRKNFPDLEIRVLQSFKFEDFQALAGKVRWLITFGEGLDDYFISPHLRGGIAFAVYNDDFFTSDFAFCPTVFRSWDDLQTRLCATMKNLIETPDLYDQWSETNRQLIEKYWSLEKTVNALRRFYEGDYDFPIS